MHESCRVTSGHWGKQGMYKVKSANFLLLVQRLFLGLGVLGLVGAAFWANHTRSFLAHASHATGTVVNLVGRSSGQSGSGQGRQATWAPEVQFVSPDGRVHTFVSSTSSSPPAYDRGESVDVLFEASNPDGAKINGFISLWGGPLIITIMCSIFAAIGAVMLLVRRMGERKKSQLLVNGRPVQADIQSAQQNTRITVNGRHPYQLVCQWQDPITSRLHVFTSENIWFDPSKFIERDTATVYLDRRNPKRFYVDISFLPKLA